MSNDQYTIARRRGLPAWLRALLPSAARTGRRTLDLDAIVRAYARYAPIYDQTFGLAMDKGRRLVIEEANRKPRHVLELGAGTGLSLPRYRADSRISAVDLSKEMLDRARTLVARKKLTNVDLIAEMDAADLRFDDATFDTVAAMYLLPVVPDPARVMAEIERVAKPGADIFIVNHFAGQRARFAAIEALLSNVSRWIGWNPDFRIEAVLDNTTLDLVAQRPTSRLGLFTLLHLRKPAE